MSRRERWTCSGKRSSFQQSFFTFAATRAHWVHWDNFHLNCICRRLCVLTRSETAITVGIMSTKSSTYLANKMLGGRHFKGLNSLYCTLCSWCHLILYGRKDPVCTRSSAGITLSRDTANSQRRFSGRSRATSFTPPASFLPAAAAERAGQGVMHLCIFLQDPYVWRVMTIPACPVNHKPLEYL